MQDKVYHTQANDNRIVIEQENGESIIFLTDKRKYLYLNKSATIIFSDISRGLTLSEITQLLVHNYHIDKQIAANYVLRVIDELTRIGVLS